MSDSRPSREHLRDALPWSVAGALPQAERDGLNAAIDARSAEDPELVAERQWLQTLREQIRASAPQRDAEPGLQALMRRVRAERSAERRAAPPLAAASPGLLERVAEWFGGRGPAFGTAMAVAVLVQSVLLGSLLLRPDQDALAPLQGPSSFAGEGAILQVTFQPQASEQAVRELLQAVGAELVSGPGALGVYQLRVAAGTEADALRELSRQPGVIASAQALR